MLVAIAGAALAVYAARRALSPASAAEQAAVPVGHERAELAAVQHGAPSAARDVPIAQSRAAAAAAAAPDIGDFIEGKATQIAGGAVAAGVGAIEAGETLSGAGEAIAGSLPGAGGGAAIGVAAVGFDVLAGALALSAAFGGPDIFDALSTGYATTPQLDATTALGIEAGRKQAKLIKADLLATATDAGGASKFARKGASTREVIL